jgi:hypothetical protein
MFITIVGARAVGAEAGAASRCGFGSGSGSDQKMRLLAAPAPQHCFEGCFLPKKIFLQLKFENIIKMKKKNRFRPYYKLHICPKKKQMRPKSYETIPLKDQYHKILMAFLCLYRRV